MSQFISFARRLARKARGIVVLPLRFVKWVARETLRLIFNRLLDEQWLIDHCPSGRADVKSVLLVRLDLIGDYVLWLDSARAYRDIYPNQKIVLCANSIWSSLAKQEPWWDEVLDVDVNRLRFDKTYCLGLMLNLRWRGFGVVIQPTFSREFAVDRLVRATGAAHRIGQVGDANNLTVADKTITDTWYTDLMRVGDPTAMELSKNAHFVRNLGATSFRSSVGRLQSPRLASPLIDAKTPYILISPGASWLPKAWPAANFAQLADELFTQYGLPVVLCGSSADQALCERIVQIAKAPLQNLAGKTSLTELLDLTAGARLVVSNDSGNIHLAAALRIPSVCILGGGHSARFMPYVVENSDACVLPLVAVQPMDCFGCHWRCQYKTEPNTAVPCVANITLSQVREKCQSVLQKLSNEYQIEVRQ